MEDIAVIFDMDGVICHTNPYHALAFDRFFRKHGIIASEEEFQEHMYGKHNSYIMKHFFKRPLESTEIISFEDEKEALFREIYRENVSPLAGFTAFLKELKEASIKTAIATSAPQKNAELIIHKLLLEDQMDSILFSEKIINHKPHPEIYLKTAENLAIAPKKCIVFEDSYSGVTAGLAANMTVVGVLSTHTKEQLPPCSDYINDFTEMNMDRLKNLLS